MKFLSANPTRRLGALVVAAVVAGGGFLTPMAASALTLYQPTNVYVQANTNPGFHTCNDTAGSGLNWAFPNDGKAADGGIESNIGNYQGELTTSFDFPYTLQTGNIVLTAPRGPQPDPVFSSGAPWGTTFPSNGSYSNNGSAGQYGCTTAHETFFTINYLIKATFPSGSPHPGTWYWPIDYVSVSSNGNQVTVPFNFVGYGRASHLELWIANIVNPVEGTYNGVNYGVLVQDTTSNQYSDVPAPALNANTYVATTPDRMKSQLTVSIPGGNTSLTATDSSGAGATVTATIYDAYYNPVAGQAIYIGVASQPKGGAQTAPVSPGGGNGEPLTNSAGQASYYAWGTQATDPGQPDTFFAQDTSINDFYIENSDGSEATVAVNITAATPNPESAGGSYHSHVTATPGSGQSASTSVDGTARIDVTLVDKFGNPERDHAISISPILSANQSTNDFKHVSSDPGTPAGTMDYSTYPYVALNCNQGPASEIPGTSCTDSNGHTYFTVSDTKTQTVSFQITDLTAGYTMPVTDMPADAINIPVITFTVGATDSASSTVNVNGSHTANVLADGVHQATVNVTLRDQHGNPEPNKLTYLYDTSGGSSTISGPVLTDANGRASFTVSDSTLETLTYEAYDATDGIWLGQVSQEPIIHFITGHVSDTLSTVSVSPSTVVGDGQGAATVTVTIVDEGSHPLAGQTVALDTSAYPDLTVVPPARTTDANGQAVFVVRSTTPNSVSLTVDVAGASPPYLATTADITFTPVPKNNSVTAVPTGPTNHGLPEATGSPDVNVTVNLSDSTSTGIANLTVELVAGSATSGPTMMTDGSGNAVFAVGLDPTATNFDVTYTALDVSDNYRPIGTVTVHYTPVPDEAHESSVVTNHGAVYTYDPSQPPATQTAVITVTLRDSSGNPIVGNDVNLLADSTYATVTAFSNDVSVSAGTTDSNGRAYFSVTDCNPNPAIPLCTPEVVHFSATDTTSSTVIIPTTQVSFVLRPDEATTSTISVTPSTVEADGQSAATVTVTLRNNGALLVGNTVSLSQGPGKAVITTSDPVSNVSGQVTFSVRDLTAQSLALQATDLTTATELTHDAVVTFTLPPGGTLRPNVTSVAPASGPGTGGTDVTITGANFLGATAVYFGTVSATTYSIAPSGTSLVAVSPIPIAAGAVDVTVVGPGGTSNTSSVDHFLYTSAPRLSLTSVAPAFGAQNGSTAVLLSGTGLISANAVYFGSVSAKFSVTNGGTTLTAIAPASKTPGTVAITVANSSTTSAITSATTFTFIGIPTPPAIALPSIVSMNPSSGSLRGGVIVTLRGTNFSAVQRVFFGTARAVIVKTNAAHTLLSVKVPAAARPGTVRVQVITKVGVTSNSSGSRYTYMSPKSRVATTSRVVQR